MSINYLGTNGELKGCLADRFGFDEAGIRTLDDPSMPPPTRANVWLELEQLVARVHLGKSAGPQCRRGGAPASAWVPR